MKNNPRSLLFFSLSIFIIISCNNKRPFKPDYLNIGGYVIGNENCYSDSTKNYWILDFNVYSNSPQIGDTFH